MNTQRRLVAGRLRRAAVRAVESGTTADRGAASSAGSVLDWKRPLSMVGAGLALAAAAGCGQSTGGTTTAPGWPQGAAPDTLAAVPLGDVAGGAAYHMSPMLANPYSGNPQAVAQGRHLFIKMNCAGCHNYGATGLIAPDLTDRYWRYGSTPASIFNSIYAGRPQGMPAWNPALPPQEIWKIVSYIESLGGALAPTQHQAWLHGDRPGQNVAPEVEATVARAAGTTDKAAPTIGPATIPSMAPTGSGAPAPGSYQ